MLLSFFHVYIEYIELIFKFFVCFVLPLYVQTKTLHPPLASPHPLLTRREWQTNNEQEYQENT